MILDSLRNWQSYSQAHPLLAPAFEFLLNQPLASLALGRHDIIGDELFALVQDSVGRPMAEAKLEVHQKYIDLQFVVSGDEVMGWSPKEGLGHSLGFDTDKDCGFYQDAPLAWFPVRPGCFTIFFPEDAHAPCCGTGVCRKIVLKIKAC